MTNPYRQDFESRLRRLANRDAPAPADFSERVMSRLHEQIAGSSDNRPARSRTLRGRPAYAALLAALSIVLLSGIAYATTQTDWFVIKDDAGREVMKVRGYEALSEVAARDERIRKTVENELSPGEVALILIGQDDIDDYLRDRSALTDGHGTVYQASRSLVYATSEELLSHLTGELDRVGALLPGDAVGEAALAYVELIPDAPAQETVPREQWTRDVDAKTGTPYAYRAYPVDEIPFPADHVSLRYTYADGGTTYRLGVVYGHGLGDITLYDKNPSTDRVHNVSGVPIYERSETNPRFTWTVPTREGSLLLLLDSPQADAKQQLNFAKNVIQAMTARQTP